MIKLIIGGIGSGKSLSSVHFAYNRAKVYANFPINLSNCERLKTDDILIRTKQGKNTETAVNWDFWKKARSQGSFDIILDEVHNILHSRRAMTKWNTIFSLWLAQIRKVLAGNESNHLILISQKVARIDSSARDLAQEICHVSKTQLRQKVLTMVYDTDKEKYVKQMLPKTFILRKYFTGSYCQEKYENFLCGEKTEDYQSYFYANPFFRYYNSYDILDFGEDVYL